MLEIKVINFGLHSLDNVVYFLVEDFSLFVKNFCQLMKVTISSDRLSGMGCLTPLVGTLGKWNSPTLVNPLAKFLSYRLRFAEFVLFCVARVLPKKHNVQIGLSHCLHCSSHICDGRFRHLG